jgi:hypothetical protein
MEYSFDDWLNGKPEPPYLFIHIDGVNPVYNQIQDAKLKTFDWSFEGLIILGKNDFKRKLEGLTDSKKKSYTDSLIKDSEIHFSNFDIKQLILKNHPQKFEGIDGQKYNEVKKLYEVYTRGDSIGFSHFKNDFLKGIVYYELTEFYKSHLEAELKPLIQNIEEPEKVEAYTNLPHALCILYDLGILDLIEKKFSDKHYKGKARETDKAKLIATILGIEDAQKIRYALKNNDYLSDKAKQNAVKTLKTLGLDPSKFTGYSF